MTFSKAKEEFQVRYYLWARSEWERQIDGSFPDLHCFKAGPAWETLQYMQQLSRHEQLLVAGGLLKRFHPDAVKTLGETCSPEEEAFRSRRDCFFRVREEYQGLCELESGGQIEAARFAFQMLRGRAARLLGDIDFPAQGPLKQQRDATLRSELEALFRPIPSTHEEGIAARKKAGEKVRFVTKSKVQRMVMSEFEKAFGAQCVGSSYDDLCDPSSFCDMRGPGGWLISTHFWFGRGASLIEYGHAISSEAEVEHYGPNGPYTAGLGLGAMLSLCAWLGICSQTEWEYLANAEDVDRACDAALEQCRHFFEAVPKLLAGLEFERIATA
jgi:hypothetical protein